MKRAADAKLESSREKSAKDGLVTQLETYQKERANAISQGDALKKAKFSALVAEVKLEIARRAFDDPLLNDEAKREAKVAQRQAEYDRRKAEHDQEVAGLERKIAEAEAKIDNVSLSESRRNVAEEDWVEFRKRRNDLYLKWDEAAVREDIAKIFPVIAETRLDTPPLSISQDVTYKLLPDYILPYVDDDGHLGTVVRDIEAYLTWFHMNHATMARVPIITGPPGSGKTRLADEAARSYAHGDPERYVARIAVDSAQENLRAFIPKDDHEPSDQLLAAALLFALFKDFMPVSYKFTWRDAQKFILAKLPPGVRVVVLVIDEFSSNIRIAERLFSGCMNALKNQTELKVVPIFAGVHRTSVPADMYNLLGMKQRTSGQATASAFELSCLSPTATSELVSDMAERWGVAYGDIINPKALGSIFDACGGSPALLMLTFMTVSDSRFVDVLSQINLNKAVGTETGIKLWNELVLKLSGRFSVLKFAELVSESEMSFATESVSDPFHGVNRAPRRSMEVATFVMERLVLLAMTGVPVNLSSPVLRESDWASVFSGDPPEYQQRLLSFTFQKAKSMVDIVPLPEDENLGRVTIPMLAVATLCGALTSMKTERSMLDPFATTPALLEKLAIESLANLFKAHRHIGDEAVAVDDLRPNSRRWGRRVTLHVPEACAVVQLEDHIGVNANLPEARTESNGKGLPASWKEGLLFMAAVNQLAIDGGSVFKELHSGVWVVIVSQSKFTMDYVPQSGDDGDSVTIGKKEATGLLEDMRKRAAWIKSALGLKKDDAMLCIYDLFTTRTLGKRFPRDDPDLFSLQPNETVLLTTKDTIRDALGPVLGLRVSLLNNTD